MRLTLIFVALAAASTPAIAGNQSSNTSSNTSSNNGVVREHVVNTYCNNGYCREYVSRRVYRDDQRRVRYRDYRDRDDYYREYRRDDDDD